MSLIPTHQDHDYGPRLEVHVTAFKRHSERRLTHRSPSVGRYGLSMGSIVVSCIMGRTYHVMRDLNLALPAKIPDDSWGGRVN